MPISQDLFEKSAAVLTEEVYTPTFFNRLNDLGFAPQSEKEANDLLDLAVALRPQREVQLQKQANASRFSSVLEKVASTQRNSGYASQDQQYKQAAQHYLSSPAVAASALNILTAKAEHMSAQGGSQ